MGDERTNALTLIGTPRQIEIASAQLVQVGSAPSSGGSESARDRCKPRFSLMRLAPVSHLVLVIQVSFRQADWDWLILELERQLLQA